MKLERLSKRPQRLATVAMILGGCSSANSGVEPCTMQVSQPILGGAALESYLGLTSDDLRAVVQIESSEAKVDAICTGVLVAPGWVLTAEHCLVIPSIQVRFSRGYQRVDETDIAAEVVEVLRHPRLDLSLLRVSPAGASDASDSGADPSTILPFQIAPDTLSGSSLGEHVVIAGFGLDDHGLASSLRFAVEPLTVVSDTSLEVDGLGASGACRGDSGGPMLVRDSHGAPSVAGILSSGSASCTGRDIYVPTSAARDWIAAQTKAGSPSPETNDVRPFPESCGGIDNRGRCLFGRAFVCVAGALSVTTCAPNAVCGWDDIQQAFACVKRENDPCQGVGSSGVCRFGDAWRCEAGHLVHDRCASCGSSCVYDASSGHALCGTADAELP